MSQSSVWEKPGEYGPFSASLPEPVIHSEHQAGLDSTLFRPACDASELVLELEAGELRVRPER